MNLKTLVKFGAIHLCVLTVALFLRFFGRENDDMSVVISGAMMYVPYLACLVILNLGLVSLGLAYFPGRLKSLSVVLTPLVFMVGYFASQGNMEVYESEITRHELWYLSLIILLLNVQLLRLLSKQEQNEKATE